MARLRQRSFAKRQKGLRTPVKLYQLSTESLFFKTQKGIIYTSCRVNGRSNYVRHVNDW